MKTVKIPYDLYHDEQDDYDLTVIIPVYNEQDNLYRVEEVFLNYFPTAIKKTKVLFVNDGSTDNSLEIIKDICHRNPEFEYLCFEGNCGLSAAIKAGFDNVKTVLTGYIDADLQTTPSDFNLLLEHIEHYEMVTGIRGNRQDSPIKKISSKMANGIRRAFTNDGMQDTGCPLKIIKTDYAKRIPMFEGLHRFLPAMIMLQQGRVKQVPVSHYPRIAGTAKFGLSNRLLGPLADCFAYLWMKRKYIHYSLIVSND